MLDKFKGWMTPERSNQFAGIGSALSQLDSGGVVDVSQFLKERERMQAASKFQEALGSEDLMAKFTPEQRQILAAMPPEAAQQIIAQTAFAQPDPSVAARERLRSSGVLEKFTPEQQAALLAMDPAAAEKIIGEVLFSQPKPGYQMVSPEQAQQLGLPPGTYQQGPDGKISAIGGDGTSVTVNTGDPNNLPGLAKVPEGFTYLYDENGQVKRDQNGTPTIVPLAGGPEDKRTKDELRARQTGAMLDNVGGLIDEVIASATKSPTTTTGLFGSVLGNIPGSGAYDLRAQLDTLKANFAFEKLQAMREASPTGGALGAVSDTELRLLSSVIANIDPNQSPEQLTANLQRAKQTWAEILGKANGTSQSQDAQQEAPKRLKYNPETGALE